MISCSDYDYIEIICLYRYPILLTCKSGAKIECVALDTKRNQEKQECIEVNESGSVRLVVLDDIVKLDVLTDNPHFSQVVFGTQG
ncbi:Rho-binding antiterminator [Vibrio sp. SCSIO 43135]|uniref:Rho-binding antiterminator n=1 Tax=Vibrio sp. SCSIO 43135 TaxID=2819096 RepID=UPI002075B416|nr:Rho-binding antiterminator [Vibrio sp. SCSIO 43135]USD42952.1 Rho-binding antiterminator [Vibrio sp. SCSIO 43135]